MQHAWKELQAHLADARERVKSGQLDEALAQVELALAIDPEYLAARTLRDRIAAQRSQAHAYVPAEANAANVPPPSSVAAESSHTFHAPGDGLARFEARARQRRIEKRMEAARSAIAGSQFGSARAALAELDELDPGRSDVDALNSELERAERELASMPGRGVWLAGGLAFAVVVLCASWIERDATLLHRSRQTSAAARVQFLPSSTMASVRDASLGLVEPPPPALIPDSVTSDSAPSPEAPASVTPPVQAAPPRPIPDRPASVDLSPSLVSAPTLPSALAEPPPPTPKPDDPPAPSAPAEPKPLAVITPQPRPIATTFVPSDENLVRDALQQYRTAYEGLDAKSAQAVWPGVDEPALERAFEGLSSQSLTFDSCEVDVHGAVATAMCRGSARYTPKIGSREPHVEGRVWNFTLRKVGARWQIDGARVGR